MSELNEIKIQESQINEIIGLLNNESQSNVTDNEELAVGSNSDEKSSGDTGFQDEDEPPQPSRHPRSNSDPDEMLIINETSQFKQASFVDNESSIVNERLTNSPAQPDTNDNFLLTPSNREDDDEQLSDDYDQGSDQVVEFVNKAIDFGANALDLSKRNLRKLPKNLLKLHNLQYLYLEGNELERLPRNFFGDFPYLKWLDLRNNKLVEIPNNQLDKQENLRYLLLENNSLKQLPCEIANLCNLSALSLNLNPMEYPPAQVIAKGLKAILNYLKNDYLTKNNMARLVVKNMHHQDDYGAESFIDDVWASDGEIQENDNDDDDDREFDLLDENIRSRRSSQLRSRSKSASRPFSAYASESVKYVAPIKGVLTTQKLKHENLKDLELKERLRKAKANANNFSKNISKLLNKRKSLSSANINVYKNEDLEKALKTRTVEKYKKKKEQIDAKLQKVHDKQIVNDFRDKLKLDQRKMYNKRLVKGVDYVEPVQNAPFDIDQNYLMILSREEREFLDKKLNAERLRSLSPGTLWKLEEERLMRDHMLQEKIREYTVKLVNRRDEKSDNPRYDRLQAAKDLQELKAIQKELEQRRYEIQFNLRAHTGGLVYRETKKLAKSATVSNVLKKNKNF